MKNARSLPNAGRCIRDFKFMIGKGMQRFLGGYVPDDAKRSTPTYPHGANMLAQASMRAGICPFIEDEKLRASSG